MEEKRYIIKETLANKVLNYLASKPYLEVAQMIADLGQLQEIPMLNTGPIPSSIPLPKKEGVNGD